MPRHTRIMLGIPFLLLLAAFLVGQGMRATAQDEPIPAAIGDIDRMAMDSDHFALNWNVAANGGGPIASSHFRLSSTIGQPIIGNFDSAHFEHHAGFWQEWIYRRFLPIITRP